MSGVFKARVWVLHDSVKNQGNSGTVGKQLYPNFRGLIDIASATHSKMRQRSCFPVAEYLSTPKRQILSSILVLATSILSITYAGSIDLILRSQL